MMPALRIGLIIAAVASLTACGLDGAARAARTTGQGFDQAECLSRAFKGLPPCLPQEQP